MILSDSLPNKISVIKYHLLVMHTKLGKKLARILSHRLFLTYVKSALLLKYSERFLLFIRKTSLSN